MRGIRTIRDENDSVAKRRSDAVRQRVLTETSTAASKGIPAPIPPAAKPAAK